MEKHKRDAGSRESGLEPGYFRIEVRPDHIIFVEPTGYMTGEVVAYELARLKQTLADVKRAGHKILILVNIGRITKHTSASRSAIKKAAELPFERGAAYGGSRMLGMIMQYLQRSIDPERAHYFRNEQDALAYLNGGSVKERPVYRFAALRFIIISSLLLVFFGVATYFSWNYTEQQVIRESQAQFAQKAQRSQSELQKRMEVYEQALYGFRGLFNASNSVERDEFDAYFRSLNLSAEFPGFTAISYVRHVPQKDLATYTATIRKDASLTKTGYPDFQVYPASIKDSYDVVTYVEPATSTANFGFDLSSDPVRLQTLQTARDSGAPKSSASITFTGAPNPKGFIITIPVYAKPQPSTVEQRRQQLVGYVNAVFRYDTLFYDALSGISEPGVAVEIHDDQGQVVYAAGKLTSTSQTIENSVEVGDRMLTVDFKGPTTYGLSPLTLRLPQTVLNSGIFAVILLTVLLVTLLRSRGQAIKLADTITVDLEHERNLAIENARKLEISEQALAEEKASVDRKVVERTQELNEARAQLEASLRGLPFGFAIIDSGHEGVFSNQALQAIIGREIPIGSASDATVKQLSTALKAAIDVDAYLHQAETTRTVVDKECMLGAKYLHILFIPIVDRQASSPQVAGSVIVLEDVTEEKALQRSRDEFFSIASHELRTPLTAIRGNASMIMETFDKKIGDPTLKQMVTDIESSSERLIAIVKDFLNVSELEQGKVSTTSTTVDLGATIAALAKDFKPQADKQKLYLHVDNPTPELTISTDPEKVKEIVSSLLSNALQFTKFGGVTVKIDKTNSTVTITVSDTGSGIPVESQHLLFRKFQQANSNILTRDSSQSTGLGLYVSKLTAELLGGKLYLGKSEVDEGATFVLELPVQLEPNALSK